MLYISSFFNTGVSSYFYPDILEFVHVYWICVHFFLFLFFFSSFLHFSPLITKVIFLKEINKWKKFLTILSILSFSSVWTSYVSPVELHKSELLNYTQLQLYKYRQWKILSADQSSSITIGIIGLTINNSDW